MDCAYAAPQQPKVSKKSKVEKLKRCTMPFVPVADDGVKWQPHDHIPWLRTEFVREMETAAKMTGGTLRKEGELIPKSKVLVEVVAIIPGGELLFCEQACFQFEPEANPTFGPEAAFLARLTKIRLLGLAHTVRCTIRKIENGEEVRYV